MMKDKNLIIIAGPTASGKSDVAIKLAKCINGEIISADSMQIYKYMDIGSAKITKEEMQGIPHYLIDFLMPDESFNVSTYKNMALSKIDDIIKRGKVPIVVGGTGLFIDSILYDYKFTDAKVDIEYRNYLSSLAKKNGNSYVHNLLKDVDNESYKKLYPNDLKRVIRALEVYKLTGKPISHFNDMKRDYSVPYDVFYFVLNMDRKELYERINKRVDKMIEKGLLDEVINLKKMGYTSDIQSMKAIGYKELMEYIDGNCTLEDAILKVKQGSRNYAKRQLTWFRREKHAIWIDRDIYKDDQNVVNLILKNINRRG